MHSRCYHGGIGASLPMQRRLNDYGIMWSYVPPAKGGMSLPKWKDYIRFPASGLIDIKPDRISWVSNRCRWICTTGWWLIRMRISGLPLASLAAWSRRR